MTTTSGPQPPSYESLTPYYHDSNPFDDSEKLSARVRLSCAIPQDLANSSTPSFQGGRYFIPSITGHKLSFSSIPPPALAHLIPANEWAAFTTSLSAATALSSGQKAKVIAAGVSVGILSCWPGVGTCIGRAVERKEIEKMISMQDENHGYEFNAADKGNVGAVLDRWNHAWGAKGVRMGLTSPGMDADEECKTAHQYSGGRNPLGSIQNTCENDTCGQCCHQNRCQRHGSGLARCRRGRSDCAEVRTRACGQRGKAQECGTYRSCRNPPICARAQRKGHCGKDRRFMLLADVISQEDDGVEECLERRFSGLKIGRMGDKKF